LQALFKRGEKFLYNNYENKNEETTTKPGSKKEVTFGLNDSDIKTKEEVNATKTGIETQIITNNKENTTRNNA